MKSIDKSLLRKALMRLVQPFLDQGTETLFFSRNETGTRYYVGAIPAGRDSVTGSPPRHQCCRHRNDVSSENALVTVLEELMTPWPEPFEKVPLPKTTWIAAVLRCQERKVIATVRSRTRIRTIGYEWKEKDATIVPPSNWTESVLGESTFQDESPPPQNPLDMFRAARKQR